MNEPAPPAMEAEGEVCACPCGHAAPIQLRVGFILCTVGNEKLCAECVRPPEQGEGVALQCHEGHPG